MSTAYYLDAQDTIISVGGRWDSFAEQNGGQRAISGAITGTFLWDHVDDVDTGMYLCKVFHACRRTQQPISLLYRCDSPSTLRKFRMHVAPMTSGHLYVSHEQLAHFHTAGEAAIASLSDHKLANKCSICCSFEINGMWVDPFCRPDVRFLPKGHSVCPKCKIAGEHMLTRNFGAFSSGEPERYAPHVRNVISLRSKGAR